MTFLEEIKQAETQASESIAKAHIDSKAQIVSAEKNSKSLIEEETVRLKKWLESEITIARENANKEALEVGISAGKDIDTIDSLVVKNTDIVLKQIISSF